MDGGPPRGEGFFEALVDGIGDGVLLMDRAGTLLWASPGLSTLLGYRLEDVVGLPILDLLDPDDVERAHARRNDPVASTWQSWTTIRRVRHADGTYRMFDCTVQDLTDDERVGGVAVVLRLATERFQAWETERRLRAIVEHSADAVLVYGRDLRVAYASPAATSFLGELEGTLIDHIDRFVHPDQLREALDLYSHGIQRPGSSVQGQFLFLRPGQSDAWVELRATNLLDDPVVAGIVFNARDVTASVELEERLREAARRDPLTGLPNRTQIVEVLEAAIAEMPARGTVAVLFLDLDRFKVVNDSFGHATGDRVLVELGRRLYDAVSWRGTVARFGGDEYVVVAVVDAPEDAVDLAEMLGRTAQEPFTVLGPDHEQAEVFLSGSVGIALATAGDAPSTLLHHADAAMYRAKERGPGTWELYDEGMRQAARSRITLEADLVRALDEGAFELHYQPIVEVESGRPVAFEALARWNHPRRGQVPPSEFIPVLEETGGIHRLGEWALAAACCQLKEWQAHQAEPLGVSVNLSPQQLGYDDLASDIVNVTDHFGIDPALVTFEITETLLMRDLDLAVKALSQLRDVGCRLALDDFGTGWSSLTYLRSVPVDSVKIDRSFIEGVADSPDDRAIVGSVVWLCRTLGKDVVAEGVETDAQYEALSRLGCTHAQGYFLARPQPAAEVTAWLADRHRS
jgi:diguanylate cyclase (GGDEF)-like protein/PAS domain S-box-containing protein